MDLQYITCSDPRSDIPVQSMINFAMKYPLVEFGVQAHPGPMSYGHSRNIWFNKFVELSKNMNVQPNIALHINYQWCDSMCDGVVPEQLSNWLNMVNVHSGKNVVQRIQLNIGDGTRCFDAQKIADLIKKFPNQKFIFPWNNITAKSIDALKQTDAKFLLLFDGSYGAGICPTKWTGPVYNDVPNGYAGGLGPKNVAENLDKINDILPSDYQTWIDAEGKLRDRYTTGAFSLDLAEKYVKNAMCWKNQNVR